MFLLAGGLRAAYKLVLNNDDIMCIIVQISTSLSSLIQFTLICYSVPPIFSLWIVLAARRSNYQLCQSYAEYNTPQDVVQKLSKKG
eukprot:COSAG02_NODE_7600_length_2940_cov_9.106301_4_plen_86_part_00